VTAARLVACTAARPVQPGAAGGRAAASARAQQGAAPCPDPGPPAPGARPLPPTRLSSPPDLQRQQADAHHLLLLSGAHHVDQALRPRLPQRAAGVGGYVGGGVGGCVGNWLGGRLSAGVREWVAQEGWVGSRWGVLGGAEGALGHINRHADLPLNHACCRSPAEHRPGPGARAAARERDHQRAQHQAPALGPYAAAWPARARGGRSHRHAAASLVMRREGEGGRAQRTRG